MSETLEIIPRYRFKNVKGVDQIDTNFFDISTQPIVNFWTPQLLYGRIVENDKFYTKDLLFIAKVNTNENAPLALPSNSLPIENIFFQDLTLSDQGLLLDLGIQITRPDFTPPFYYNDEGLIVGRPNYYGNYNGFVDGFFYYVFKVRIFAEYPPITKFTIDKTHVICDVVKPTTQAKFRSYPINQAIDYSVLHTPPRSYFLECNSNKSLDYLEVIEQQD